MGAGAPLNANNRSTLAVLGAALLAGLAVPFFGSACGDSGSPGNVKRRPDAGPPCLPGIPSCPTGTVCNNGICIAACAADGTGCAASQFCEGAVGPTGGATAVDQARRVCVPQAMTVCTVDQDCPLPQFCRSGLCISRELRRDGGESACILFPSDGGNVDDACAPEAVCLQEVSSSGATHNYCIGMPACPLDGTCPVGNVGSVCNDLPDGGRLFPDKQRVCLFTFCASGANCPADTHCFLPSSATSRGQCLYGFAGDPCFTDADCGKATRCAGADGGVADGGVPGRCQ